MKKSICFVLIPLFLMMSCGNSPSQESWVEEQIDKANILIDDEKYAEAVKLLEYALAKAENEFGENHKAVGDISRKLAIAYYLVEKPQEAESFFLRALNNYEKTLVANDPLIAELLVDLGTFYEDEENISKAIAHFSRAVEIYKKNLVPDHPLLIDIQRYVARLEKERTEETFLISETGEESTEPELGQPEREVKLPEKEKAGKDSFEILDVESPEIVTFDPGVKEVKLPMMEVTYRLNTTKDQIDWVEDFQVICPDGKILDGGGGNQWYNASQRGNNKTYTVKGYSISKNLGVYRFKLTLKGKSVKTQVVERSFEVK